MQVSVDGGSYSRISTSASGSAKLDNLITEPGKHVISLRARDKALNVSSAKTFTYYYDSTMPTIESGSIAYNKDTKKATVRLSNVSCGLIGFANEVKYAIIKSGDAEVTDVSSLNKTATITFTDKTGKFELSSDDMNLSDGIYNVYISISDNSGHNSDIYSLQLFKFANASYDGEEVLSSEYDEDNNVVTLSWNEDSNIQSVDVYARYGEEGKFALEQTVTGAYKLNIATSKITTQADYRLVVNYANKQKLSSAVTVVKSEEENEDGTTKISYDMDSIDTDEDGLKTSEEIEKGTNPYLKDSDFDGYNDSSDSNPIKTDVSNQNNATYTTDVHMGLYDKKFTETDEDGKKSSYVCNIYSGITSQSIDIFGNITSYYYDSNSNNTACIKYYGGQFITNIYTYDKLENMVYMARNDFGYAFNYDNIGNLISIKIADRVLVNNTYRKTNDLDEDNESVYVNSSITYGNGTKYEYVYDTNNENIVSIKINNVLSYEMKYDENGNMIEQKDHINNINYTYEYNDEGNIIRFNSSDGFSINSSSEKVVSETDTVENGKIVYSQNEEKRESIYSLHTTDEEVSEISTLISGDKVNIKTNGSNKKETYVTNDKEEDILSVVVNKNDDNTATINNNGVIKKYTYDKYNNISAISNNGELLTSYKYDNLEQLTRENDVTSGKTITYKYDKGGNIINKKIYDYSDSDITSEAVETIDYEYKDSTWKDMLTKYDNQEITYDEIGNPLKYRDDMNFTWENGRCLSTVTNNNTKIKYSYNKDGVRVSKNVDGIITKYYLKDYDIIGEETNGNIIWYLYNSSGNLLGFENNGNAYYYEKNLQNDIIGILDNTGKNLVSYYYDAFGNITKIDGDSKLAKINPFRYRGYYYDEETGLYYLNSRYYDSKTGRFINADDPNMAIISAITNNNGNLYSYCNNNLVKNMDTTGYWITVDSLILNSISAITNWLKLRNPIINGIRLTKAATNYLYNKKRKEVYKFR